MPVWHAGKEETADEMREAVLLHERLEGLPYLVRPPYEKAVLHQPVEIGGDGGVDEGMPPASRVFLSVGDHDVPLGQLARLGVGVGDDHVAGEGPLGGRRRAPGRRALREEVLLAREEAGEVRGGTGDPVVGEGGRPLQGQVAPSPDPDGWMRLTERARLEVTLDLIVPSLERDGALRPQRLHDGELLLEARPALLELGSVEGELV